MSGQSVQDHYSSSGDGGGIAARIVAALRVSTGANASITPTSLAPFDHFHGGGLAATRELATALDAKAGEAILDIGSGIGGPARWIAESCSCAMTGIDLTPEFCEAARELNGLSGMAERVKIIEGSALALPLPDAAFDRAYSQFVVMNIADKASVYSEAHRVLKPSGRLVLCHVNAGQNGAPEFPLPWASVPENSFLATDEDTRRDLSGAGFEIVSFRDTTQGAPALRVMRQKLETEGLPPIGSHVLVGDHYLQLMINVLRSTEQGRMRTVEVVARKRT